MLHIHRRPTFRPFLLFTLLAFVFILGQRPLTVSAEKGAPVQESISKMPDEECDGLELCIKKLSKPAIGQRIRNRLTLRGTFPAEELEITVRNAEETVVYSTEMTHNGSKRLKVWVGDVEWQEGSYTITVSSQETSFGDSWDLDLVANGKKLIRAGGSPLDLEKLKAPAIGQMMSSPLRVVGTFEEEISQVDLTLPNGDVVPGSVISQSPDDIWVDVEGVTWEDGTYHLTVVSESGHTDTLDFGVGHLLQKNERAPMGCIRRW